MPDVSKEYLNALDRLVNNKPTNTELKYKAKLGRLKINISTVAQEAGRSRTAIGTDNTKYPEVRARILEQMKPSTPANTSADVIKILRSKNAELQKENKLVWTENANLIRQLANVNRERDKIKKVLARSRSTKHNTVVPLIPDADIGDK